MRTYFITVLTKETFTIKLRIYKILKLLLSYCHATDFVFFPLFFLISFHGFIRTMKTSTSARLSVHHNWKGSMISFLYLKSLIKFFAKKIFIFITNQFPIERIFNSLRR